MKIVLGGIRGSFPLAQPQYMKYGGETTSVLVRGAAGERVLIDLGTGAHRLGAALGAEKACSTLVLITHYHLDHVIGLPSMPLIYDERCRVEFAAPVRDGRTIEQVLPRLLADPFWPLQLHAMDANIVFTTFPDDGFASPRRHGGLEIRWAPVHHPAGCTAYRVDEPSTGASMVFATDVEWALSDDAERAALLRLVREPTPAGILFFDAHFTPQEYPGYRNWGHSTWADALSVARATGARRVQLIHHSQFHDDAALDAIDAAVRAEFPGAGVAVGGSELDPCTP